MTDTTIWKNQKWFKSLSVDYKLAFFYIKDNCDHAGIWTIDCPDLIEHTGIRTFNISDFVDLVNVDYDKFSGEKIVKTRILLHQKKYIWIVKFIEYQYETKDFLINPMSPVVYSALTILDGHGLLKEGLVKGYFRLSQPYFKGMLRTKDKDKDKDNERLKEGAETIKGNKYGSNPNITLSELKKQLNSEK